MTSSNLKNNKLSFTLDIEVPNSIKGVFPEEGESLEDYSTKEKKKELEDFRVSLAKDVLKAVKTSIKDFIPEEFFNYLMENNEEIEIEGLESLKDYGIKIKLKENKEIG
jgi:hypothetical protein